MTPERWREVDGILQAALACAPERRNAVVAAACGDDEALRREVASLLDAHVGVATGFLEQPVAAELSALFREMIAHETSAVAPAPQPVSPEPQRTRTVSARGAFYAAVGMLVIGLAGGFLLDVSSLIERFTADAPKVVQPAADAGVDAQAAVAGAALLTVVDRAGKPLFEIPAERPWTPRFSPDGKRVAYGAFGSGRTTSDLWVTDLEKRTTKRLTDDDADSNDPHWSADGKSIAYSAGGRGGKDVVMRPSAGGSERVIAAREGMQYPSDWLRDGSALLVTEEAGSNGRDILVQPADGSPARAYAATSADETAARISPDGRWVAYTSNKTGRAEVYLDAYPQRGRRVMLSSGGGVHAVWRADGKELYYWRDGALIAVPIDASSDEQPLRGAEAVLFRAPYHVGVNTMYDVSPDGKRFVIVREP